MIKTSSDSWYQEDEGGGGGGSTTRSGHERFDVMATFHLTISMGGQRATGKIQRNNYHHGSCGPSLTSKTSSVSFIVMH